MVPQGGNTGLVGGATPNMTGDAVIISLARLDRVREIDRANYTITVEAGCVLQQVQAAAEAADRLFPLSLAAQGSCQIGGNLSTNAGGVHVLRYGNTRELTLGLEVVLPDATVWDGLRGLRKDNTGYDLKHLFIGAEGTLGVITAAVMKLFPRPRAQAVTWFAVTCPRAAVELLAAMRSEFGDRVTAFEIIAWPALALVLANVPDTRNPLRENHDWHVLLELSDTSLECDLADQLERALASQMERGAIVDAVVARSNSQAAALWRLRESISEAQRVEGFSIKHDISVPVSHVPRFLELAEPALRQAFGAVRIVAFGHIGDGNLHYNLSKPTAVENDRFIAQTSMANRIVHDLVASLGGSISAEHGLGQLKREEIKRYKSAAELDMMRAIKKVLDPYDLMNPGKVV